MADDHHPRARPVVSIETTSELGAASAYQQSGYAAVPLFDPVMVRDAATDISDHIDRISRALYLPDAAGLPDTPLTERIDRIWENDRSHAALIRQAICTDAHRGPRLQALAQSPVLKAVAEDLAAHRLADSVVRVRASIACFPEHRHPWHSDVARDDGTRCGSVLITAWIPLSDAGPKTGGLEIIPGRRATPMAQEGAEGFSIPEDSIAALPRVAPVCPAGSVLFLDRFTPHRTLAVTEARFSLVIWMIAA